ncbi:mandelate racemase/muconate lactonizing enzyme family protein [Thalassococcus sp. S3]|uniref:mandelate racemase/muconate lactonizing enzyme family protein n=1 Tax=Thalassococcus sp. S3 TaxID=2017482 RepID=UPI00102480D1|nr:mandelate racemase/muconate lactonizing enzyme family protein [Thalassococcus sp. S3]QBF32863.1 muconate cycloisomerase [Thalassococcus sp. S3]
MKIKDIRIRPLTLPLRQPYHWTQGIRTSFSVNVIELEAADGTIGVGECTVAPNQEASARILRTLAQTLIGESLYDAAPLRDRILREHYMAVGANTMRAANQMLAGLDFAVWDAQGKVAGRPVSDLLGGAYRRKVGYFFFLQGDTPEDLARHAAKGAAAGERVFYLKVGRPDQEADIDIVRAVRAEIGEARLRLDANEGWDPYRAIRMCRKLEPFDIDFIEQPTSSWSLEAMAHVRQSVGIPIVADQAAFTLYDVYEICRRRAADMICIGPREVGGIQNMLKAATVAEAAGLSICIHSSFTTGITTAAEHQIARMIPNLDDGNQIMWQLARDNIVAHPSIAPQHGWLEMPDAPGLGITLDETIIAAHAN